MGHSIVGFKRGAVRLAAESLPVLFQHCPSLMVFLGGQQALLRTKTLLLMPISCCRYCPHRISNAIMPALQFLNDAILTAIDDTVNAQALLGSKIFLKTDSVTHT